MSENHGRNSTQKRLLKAKLFGSRDTARCVFCRSILSFGTATLEHKIPLSHGGGWDLSNLALSCYDCNQERGNLDFETFRLQRKARPACVSSLSS